MTTLLPARARLRASAFALLFSLAVPASLPAPAFAHDYKAGDLQIDHPWSRATPGGAKVAGGFMTIRNNGKDSDRLVGGTFDASGIVEIHEMKMDGGVMKMRALELGLEIKPGQSVELKPGGYHVMFIDLKRPLKEGESVKGELVFEKAGRIAVEYKIENRGAKSGSDEHGGHKGHGAPKS